MKPTPRFRSWLGAAIALAAVRVFSPSARAAVGDDVATVAADQARLHASLRIFRRDAIDANDANGGFTVHELAAASGVTIRNFVADAGKIFAVSWSGGWRPNLRDIMGSHYDRFIAATRGRRVARGVARIELPGMIVVMGGPQRASFGHVILTDLAPAGFIDQFPQIPPIPVQP
jgi:hypothetical protein